MATPSLAPRIRFKTPAICHKSFVGPPDLEPGDFPITLNGFAAWVDPDPLNPADFTSTLTIRRLGAGPIYRGKGPGKIDFFQMILLRSLLDGLWYGVLQLNGQRVPPEEYEFQPFAIDLTKPLDTGIRTEHPALPTELRQFQFTY